MSDLGWHVIHGEDLLTALRRAAAEGADVVFAELWANAEADPPRTLGDSQRAAAALAHMPRWVAVHENTLAKLDVAVATLGADGVDVDVVLAEMDEARAERDRATGVNLDGGPS